MLLYKIQGTALPSRHNTVTINTKVHSTGTAETRNIWRMTIFVLKFVDHCLTPPPPKKKKEKKKKRKEKKRDKKAKI